ncbi:MAG: AAA family ATPase [Gemmatimonadaceae bacterium]
MFSLQTLGALRLIGDDGEVLAGRRKELALLAYLARRAPRQVLRAELATLLWGERDEARARHSLRQALLQLKRVLGDALVVESERVFLRGPLLLDVAELERAIAEEHHAEATALWRGEFMSGLEDAGGENYRLWVEAERAALRGRVGSAFDVLVTRAESRGEWTEGLGVAERWSAAFPLDDRAEYRLIQLLRLVGREGDARARYADFDTRVREELGRGPAPDLERIGARLNRGDGVAPPGASAAGGALFTPDLVGRGAAFAELVAAWEGVRGGATAVVLVEGERGLGKTRLCQEFIDWVMRREESSVEAACVLWERGEAGDGAPWSTARRLLARLATAPGLAGASPEDLAEVAQLVPAVRLLYRELPLAAGDDAGMTGAVVEVLRAVASEVPVLLCVDDFTLADASTQRLMLAIARRLRGPGGVLLLLVDHEGGAAPADEARGASELRVMRTTRRLHLQPLGRAEVETMLGSMLTLDAADRAALAGRLTDAGGNPQRVVDSVTATLGRGELRHDGDGGWILTPIAAAPDETGRAPSLEAPPVIPPRRRRRGMAFALAGAVAAGVGVLYAARARQAEPPAALAVENARSIAVMPFSHASADTATEYFTAGVTEELVHALSSVPGLRVAARTSVRSLDGKRLTAREIGRALGVDAVIEGSVRTAGGRARITVQLVNAADGYDVWSERYDRDMRDVLGVQDEIARAVVEKLRPRGATPVGAGTPAAARDTRDPRAHDLFLRARYLTNRSGEPNLLKAIAYYQKAIAIDSEFARAYAGLADAQLTLLEWGHPYSATAPAAREKVVRALRLDPRSSDGHMALGRLHRYDWQWKEAEREFRRALAANPSDVQARHSLSHVLISLARLDESLAESRLAVQLDPLDPRIAMHLCYHYIHARAFGDALTACQKGLELDPNFPDSHSKLAWVYDLRGDGARALEEIDSEMRVSGPRPEYRAQRALIQARMGQRALALTVMRAIERETPRGERPVGTMASVYAALGDRDAAFLLLEQGYAEHSSDLATLSTEPTLDPLRTDPRFARLVALVGVAASPGAAAAQ